MGITVLHKMYVYISPYSVYTMQLMLECKVAAVSQLPPSERRGFTYSQLGREAMGAVGKWMVDFAVLGCNLGVCAGYMIFISSNLRVGTVPYTGLFWRWANDTKHVVGRKKLSACSTQNWLGGGKNW